MAHDLLFNALMMDPGDDEDVVRYLQVGMVDADGFTGLITDYAGADEWDDLYVLQDTPLTPVELDLDADADVDAAQYEAAIEAAYPGLIAEIWERREELVEPADGPEGTYLVAIDELLELARGARADQLLSDAPGALAPVEAFNTSFDPRVLASVESASGDEAGEDGEAWDEPDPPDDDDPPPWGLEDDDDE